MFVEIGATMRNIIRLLVTLFLLTNTLLAQQTKQTIISATAINVGTGTIASAFDGSTSTRWGSSNTSGAWITFDLGSSKTLSQIRLKMYAGESRTYPIRIDVDNNASPTTSVWTGSTTQTADFFDIPLTATGRYVKLTMTGLNTASPPTYYLSIYEAEIYSPGSTTNYTLTTSSIPSAGGSITLNPAGGNYAAGTVVTLTASAGAGYQFSNWSGALSSSTSPTTITMNANVSVSANFSPVSGYQAGDMEYYNGTTWTRIPKGKSGQVLTQNNVQIPTWKNGPKGKLVDFDGNVYETIVIGNQEWTVTNIRTTTFNDGTPIGWLGDNQAWLNATGPTYCFYDNTTDLGEQQRFGALYNRFTVTSSKNIAPLGWRVPSQTDWVTLQNYLIANGNNFDGTVGGNKVAKSVALGYWNTSSTVGAPGNNLPTNNQSGFSALASGYRSSSSGIFYDKGTISLFWSSTPLSSTVQSSTVLNYNDVSFFLGAGASDKLGYSIRLVRDLD